MTDAVLVIVFVFESLVVALTASVVVTLAVFVIGVLIVVV